MCDHPLEEVEGGGTTIAVVESLWCGCSEGPLLLKRSEFGRGADVLARGVSRADVSGKLLRFSSLSSKKTSGRDNSSRLGSGSGAKRILRVCGALGEGRLAGVELEDSREAKVFDAELAPEKVVGVSEPLRGTAEGSLGGALHERK